MVICSPSRSIGEKPSTPLASSCEARGVLLIPVNLFAAMRSGYPSYGLAVPEAAGVVAAAGLVAAGAAAGVVPAAGVVAAAAGRVAAGAAGVVAAGAVVAAAAGRVAAAAGVVAAAGLVAAGLAGVGVALAPPPPHPAVRATMVPIRRPDEIQYTTLDLFPLDILTTSYCYCFFLAQSH
ncbi:MAG: hypothetical protein HW403_54 [Dehalococcoidia bacterium]|nr:hypothetical protein [Dehalococcoidia bacterium]